MGYCVVLSGVLHGTAGYCWLLLCTGWYWGALKCTWGLLGVLWSTLGYCRVLLETAGFCQVLHGTTGYSGGTRCILGETEVLEVPWGTGGYGGTWE